MRLSKNGIGRFALLALTILSFMMGIFVSLFGISPYINHSGTSGNVAPALITKEVVLRGPGHTTSS